ncbi:hypothetical protein J7E97_12580 [Streptomyces sp. ISL-66]|uniref:hypothetical protein n=1 Tax=Streptomyces sp. ISL-66 TaxID=2819186 RepID=UPI001BEBA510|nr:hypothetical protein [Streptomyces sp. ISL-66]MBT2468691.1 hypothetical protein [Streptomyces sp. ISL-66]
MTRGKALLSVVIAAGLALGGWALYDAYRTREDSRAEITEACQGLVDPDAVMRFGGSGNKVDADSAGQHLCVLRREVTFEGQEEMHPYFSLTVAASNDAEPGESRFDLGVRSVAVTAKCADPVKSGGVTSLRVTAATEYDRADRGEPGTLAALARGAALRAAAKAGCETALPRAPKD